MPFLIRPFPLFKSTKQARIENLGRERINKVLEIDNFIKSQIKFKVLVRTLLTKAEQYLLNNQRQFVLQERTDSDKSGRAET